MTEISLLIFITWLLASMVLIGIGWLLNPEQSVFISFWNGFTVSLFVLTVTHFGIALDWRSALLCLGLGVIGLVRRIRVCPSVSYSELIVLVASIAFLVPYATLRPRFIYDDGLYHLQVLDWYETYPLVPGLANLHGRFGFNSSYYLFAAPFGLLPGGSIVYVAGLLTVGLLVGIVTSMWRLRCRQARFHDILLVVCTVSVLEAIAYGHLAGLSNDYVIMLLTIVLSARFISYITTQNRTLQDLTEITFMAVAGVTLKLSFVFFAATVIVIVLLMARHAARQLVWCLLPAGALLLVWMLHGVGLSGYPLYPSTVGAFSVDWRVPEETTKLDAQWILSWARQPGASFETTLYSSDWLLPWLIRAWSDGWLIRLLLVIALGAVLTLFYYRHVDAVLYSAPALVGITAWFVTAPDIRFVVGAFWVLAGGLLALGLKRHRPYLRAIVIVVIVGVLSIQPVFQVLWLQQQKPSSPLPVASTVIVHTADGLAINMPSTGDQCWQAPLPCTPYAVSRIQMRGPNLAFGFRTLGQAR